MNKLIAHRGFSSKRLENTIEAFEMAFNKEYIDTIELDIRMTKDKKIVCVHDSFIKSNISEKEYIKNINSNDLEKHTLKNKDFWLKFFKYGTHLSSFKNLHRLIKYRNKKGTIPLLSGVLDLMPKNKKVIIEIKGKKSDYENNTYEEEILKVVDKYNSKQFSIMSFDKDIVMSIKKIRPKFKMGILIEKQIKNIDLTVDFVSISKKVISYDIVKQIIGSKKEVIVWTINTYNDYKFIKKECGDLLDRVSITTDFPDLMNSFLEKQKITK